MLYCRLLANCCSLCIKLLVKCKGLFAISAQIAWVAFEKKKRNQCLITGEHPEICRADMFALLQPGDID